jgi:hypothetical protein
MMRKLLIVGAAVAMSASALAAATAVGSTGAAGALAMKTKTYTTQECAITGSVTFAAPGLSYAGTLSKGSTSKAVSSATSTGTGCGSGTATSATLNSKIVSPSTNCETASSPPPACSGETTKEHYVYDNSSSLASSGVSSIVSSLGPKGLKLFDNGHKVIGAVTSGGTSAVDPGGACGTNVGFQLQGNTNVSTLTYDLLLCITGDTGTDTTGSFYNDYIASDEGDNSIVIATGIFGGNSALNFTES